MRVLWELGGLTGRRAKGREATCLPAYNLQAHLISFISRSLFFMTRIWSRSSSLHLVLEATSNAVIVLCIRPPCFVIQCSFGLQSWFAVWVCYLAWSRSPLRLCHRAAILLWTRPLSAPSPGCAVATLAVWCLWRIPTFPL